MKERRTKPPELGRTGVVENLIRQGRIPTFSDPAIRIVNGLPKKIVQCTIPGENGQEPSVVSLSPGNATQIKRSVEHALKSI